MTSLLAGLAMLLLALPAGADDDGPKITRAPTVGGEPVVGGRLEALDARWQGHGEPTYHWLRCDSSSRWSCEILWAATEPTYTLTAADQGKRMRVWLVVSDGRERDDALSDPSAVVIAAPPPVPPPPPAPVVPPPPAPIAPAPVTPPAPDPVTPAPDPVTPAPDPVTTPPAPDGAVRGARARPMRPSPVVRIRGWLTPRGARISLLTVHAPRGAHITVRCLGRHCPRERWARTTIVTRVRAFEGVLRAGTRLEVRVTRPGFVGKHTIIHIRRDEPPTRRDRCLYPGTRKPRPCPGR